MYYVGHLRACVHVGYRSTVLCVALVVLSQSSPARPTHLAAAYTVLGVCDV